MWMNAQAVSHELGIELAKFNIVIVRMILVSDIDQKSVVKVKLDVSKRFSCQEII
jgi:hypothetical protein